MQLLHRLSHTGNRTIFLSTHDLELALQIADKVWLMNKEHGVKTGTPEDLSLDGSLSHFFLRKGIKFDMESGLFRIAKQATVFGAPHRGRIPVYHGAEGACQTRYRREQTT